MLYCVLKSSWDGRGKSVPRASANAFTSLQMNEATCCRDADKSNLVVAAGCSHHCFTSPKTLSKARWPLKQKMYAQSVSAPRDIAEQKVCLSDLHWQSHARLELDTSLGLLFYDNETLAGLKITTRKGRERSKHGFIYYDHSYLWVHQSSTLYQHLSGLILFACHLGYFG